MDNSLNEIGQSLNQEMDVHMTYIEKLIKHLDLAPLQVEGGLFKQTYLSTEMIPVKVLESRYPEDKPINSAILYLLTAEMSSFSAMHKLPTDEIYHFYLGDPVELLQLYPDGSSEKVILGHDVLNGQRVQYNAPQGVWQGSHLVSGGQYALMGTTMAPAFTHDDYIGAEQADLIREYPHEAELIKQLTRPDEPLSMQAI
jgi:uncharacterized protein